jgi:hypothetical protein
MRKPKYTAAFGIAVLLEVFPYGPEKTFMGSGFKRYPSAW